MAANAGRSPISRAVELGLRVVLLIRAAEVPFLAASIAYYALLSLLPLLLLLLAVASVVAGAALAETLVTAVGELLTPAGEAAIREAFEGAAGRGGATVAGLAFLIWTALRVFRGLDVAFSKVYGFADTASIVTQVRNGLAALLGIGVGTGVILAVGWVAALTDLDVVIDVLGVLVLPVILAILFLPLYYVFPGVDVSVREVIPGALLAAVGWTVLQAGFRVYATAAPQYHAYGVLGGILLLVTWFYLAAIVLLSGAAVNVVLAGRDDRQLQQGSALQPFTTMDGDTRSAAPGDETETGHERRAREDDVEPKGAPDVTALADSVEELRADFDSFSEDVRERTVDKPTLEAELKRYVRSRMRRGHARGWGPYLVLLYGTILTLGAFAFLDGIYAIVAMVILFLSTLGLYTLFILVGVGLNVLGLPGRVVDRARDRRE